MSIKIICFNKHPAGTPHGPASHAPASHTITCVSDIESNMHQPYSVPESCAHRAGNAPHGNRATIANVVRVFIFMALFIPGFAPSESRAEANSGRLQFEQVRTVITQVSRDSIDGMILISTTHGNYFTRLSRPLPLKSGSGFITLRDSVFESLLIAHVNKPAVLTICRDVDGLVVGAAFEDGSVRNMPVSFQQN